MAIAKEEPAADAAARPPGTFVNARVSAGKDFSGVHLNGADFSGAVFEGDVVFDGAVFDGPVVFGPSAERRIESRMLIRSEVDLAQVAVGSVGGQTHLCALDRSGGVTLHEPTVNFGEHPGMVPTAALETRLVSGADGQLYLFGVTSTRSAFVGQVRWASIWRQEESWADRVSDLPLPDLNSDAADLITAVHLSDRFLFGYVTGSGSVKVLDLRGGTVVCEVTAGTDAAVTCVALGVVEAEDDDSGDATVVPLLVAGHEDGWVWAWNVDRGGWAGGVNLSSGGPHLPVRHDGAVRAVAISARSATVISAGDDATVRRWPLRGRDPPAPIATEAPVTALGSAIAHGEPLLVAGTDSGTLLAHEVKSGVSRLHLPGAHLGGVTSVAVLPGEPLGEGSLQTIAISAGKDRLIRGWPLTARRGARFVGRASFRGVSFNGDVQLAGCVFESEADYSGSAFAKGIDMSDSAMVSVAFERCRFSAGARLSRVLVGHAITFAGSTFAEPVALTECAFDDAEFGEIHASDQLSLRHCYSKGRLGLERATLQKGLICERSFFRRGVDLAAARLGSSQLMGRHAQPLVLRRLMNCSLEGDSAVANADVSTCQFSGAVGLDKLRLGAVRFAPRPALLAGRRATIADDIEWRRRNRLRHRLGLVLGGGHYRRDERSAAAELARVYRELRKAKEDAKDEPGAADLYYGEMEMRKFSDRRPVRTVITLYWLLSGYGLRPLRSIAALVALLLVAAILVTPGVVTRAGGFKAPAPPPATPGAIVVSASPPAPPDSFGDSLVYLSEVTVTLSSPQIALTTLGQIVRLVTRIMGPVLLGLTVLAIRGRVKR